MLNKRFIFKKSDKLKSMFNSIQTLINYNDELQRKSNKCDYFHIENRDNKDIIGWIGFVIQKKELYIADLQINEQYQRKGYGTEILDYLKIHCSIFQKDIVLYSGTNAEQFWRKNNFIQTNKTISTEQNKEFVWKHSSQSCNCHDQIKINIM
eukprot:397820_1